MTPHMFPVPGEKSCSNSIAFQVPLSLTAHTSHPFPAFPGAQERTWGYPRKISLHSNYFTVSKIFTAAGENILECPRGKHWLQLNWVTLLFPRNIRENSAIKATPDGHRAQGRLRAVLTSAPGSCLIHFSGSPLKNTLSTAGV